jgi:hypothetical protein
VRRRSIFTERTLGSKSGRVAFGPKGNIELAKKTFAEPTSSS